MKYRSTVPLLGGNSETRIIRRYSLSAGAIAVLDQLRAPHDCTIAELRGHVEDAMARMNPDQRRKLLEKMGKLLKELK